MDTLLQSVRVSNPYVIAILKNPHNVAILKKCSRQMRSDISLCRGVIRSVGYRIPRLRTLPLPIEYGGPGPLAAGPSWVHLKETRVGSRPEHKIY